MQSSARFFQIARCFSPRNATKPNGGRSRAHYCHYKSSPLFARGIEPHPRMFSNPLHYDEPPLAGYTTENFDLLMDNAMPRRPVLREPNDQLLGEFETDVILSKQVPPTVQPGESIYLIPEPDHPQHPHAIRVENANAGLLGYLPRKTIAWLGPIVATKKIRLEGYVPSTSAQVRRASTTRIGVVVIVFQTQGANLLAPLDPANAREALHEMVRHTYCAAQGYQEPETILGLARSLPSLERQPMLPETRLLLAMLPGSVREVRAFHGLWSIVEFRDLLGKLSFGEPKHYDNLTFFPLFWPETRQPPYTSLPAAIADGTAVIEEIVGHNENEINLVVTNRGANPLLIAEGEIVMGKRTTGIVADTVLVAQGTSLSLALAPIARWRSNRLAGGHHRPVTSPDHFSQQQCSFPPFPLAAGVVAASSGRILGMDLFASNEILQTVWAPLADAYFIDAVHGVPSGGRVPLTDVQQYVERVGGAATASKSPLALGSELEIENETLWGHATLYAGHLCHLWAVNK